jgi:Rad3-related DNA helicase
MILDFFPHEEPRPQQLEALKQIEESWNSHDVFVVQAPTATGKEALGVTIARWAASKSGKPSTIAVPTNMLVDQLAGKHADVKSLHRKDHYTCASMGMSCSAVQRSCKSRCRGCVFDAAMASARSAKVRVMNFYTYLANRMFGDTVVLDEAHTVLDVIQDQEGFKLWHFRYRYPKTIKTTADLLAWIENQPFSDELAAVRTDLLKVRNNHIIEHTTESYHGHPAALLKVRPVNAKDAQPWLWPERRVRKVVLMSATIGPQDVKDLGLDMRRVKYIEVDSPIPPVNREIWFTPAANAAHKVKDQAVVLLAERISRLMEQNQPKGLIHLPYEWAKDVAALVNSPRLIRHDRTNKQAQLQQFRDSADGVLLASGMYEGVDLPYDAARWQIVGKVPFLSLGEVAIAERATLDPKWYAYQAIRKVVQAAGRVCRTPDDWGVTYIIDSQFERLYRNNQELFPKFFKQAVRGIS